MKNNQPRRLFVCLEGFDLNDVDAIEAFAQRVWEQAMTSWKPTTLETTRGSHMSDDDGIEEWFTEARATRPT